LNALSQTMLRLTTPGVPDLYQGADFWDFSLVDPDNRGAVDFEVRKSALSSRSFPAALVRDWRDGRIKQYTIARALEFRRRHAALFVTGTYRPIPVVGPQSGNVLAFLREAGTDAALVLAPRCCIALLGGVGAPLIPEAAWSDTALAVPAEWSKVTAHDMILDQHVTLGTAPRVGSLLAAWPTGLFRLTSL
jgi:(1->4)-alpha-D-glucan 1-alpha-D-glucosylmutase